MKTFLFTLIILFSSTIAAFAQPGILDGDFDADGKVTTNVSVDESESVESILVQPDGKIIAVGYARIGSNLDFALVRYNFDGSLDNSFSVDGIVTTDLSGVNDFPRDAALQSDGKIVVVGYVQSIDNDDMVAVRYNPDGTLDDSFGINGIVMLESPAGTFVIGDGLAIQPDGKICLIGGSSSSVAGLFVVTRLNTDGSLDNTFSVNGTLTTSFDGWARGKSIALQADGKILVAGSLSKNESWGTQYSMAVARYNVNGTLDPEFDMDGKATVQFGLGTDIANCSDMLVQNDGKMVLVGSSGETYALARINIDGSSDNTFGIDGRVFTAVGLDESFARGVALQADNKILAAGYTANFHSYEFALVRYNTNGTLDDSFSLDGIVTSEFGSNEAYGSALAIQPDGRIVVGGRSINGDDYFFAVARFISGVNIGILDFAVDNGSVMIYPNPIEASSILKYQLQKDEALSCHVYDMNGKLVQTLFSSQKRPKGVHTEVLGTAASLPSGNYLLTLDNGTDSFSLKIIKG